MKKLLLLASLTIMFLSSAFSAADMSLSEKMKFVKIGCSAQVAKSEYHYMLSSKQCVYLGKLGVMETLSGETAVPHIPSICSAATNGIDGVNKCIDYLTRRIVNTGRRKTVDLSSCPEVGTFWKYFNCSWLLYSEAQ